MKKKLSFFTFTLLPVVCRNDETSITGANVATISQIHAMMFTASLGGLRTSLGVICKHKTM
jgi:hypothetical protein